ncbi:tetratricopeptide repeat protein [Methylobrevis pamukkalensis]|uniref:Localization factor PodJL n=1 Tax=Methylobrevis pamukkalensis TaxID=1439726 RepID=A0A1E3H4V8_9HYPH|nr:hypothetical protein [Methylobrevis pamukkalensis]ODN71368.1 Localization factor PodJL [Methylobrevis pamukkalensis]
MYIDGEGGEQDSHQAARWLLLAAKKGQIDAQVRLGELLVTGDGIKASPVHGLMWLTVALKRAQTLGYDDRWIREKHEAAFSLAGEPVRRRAMEMADQWIANNSDLVSVAAQ